MFDKTTQKFVSTHVFKKCMLENKCEKMSGLIIYTMLHK